MNKQRLCTAAGTGDSKNTAKIRSSMEDYGLTGPFAFSGAEVGGLVAGQTLGWRNEATLFLATGATRGLRGVFKLKTTGRALPVVLEV
jgi:hypothetical protein